MYSVCVDVFSESGANLLSFFSYFCEKLVAVGYADVDYNEVCIKGETKAVSVMGLIHEDNDYGNNMLFRHQISTQLNA